MPRLLLAAALAALGVACSRTGWEQVPPAALDPDGQARLASARAAVDALGGRLKADLLEALGTGGAGAAVAACQQLAPRIAREVAREHDLALGRTSHRLRSTANTAPGWAAATVRARTDGEQVWLGPGGSLGYLRPIPTAPLCLQCHGGPDDLDPAAKLALAEFYAEDAATGFQVGDVRGYFWAEVP